MSNKEYNEEKEKEQRRIHANNLLEEASEIVEKCTQCGFCNGVCPTYKISREERVSPRGIAILLKEKMHEEVIFQNTLSQNQETICPARIKLNEAIVKAREARVLLGKTNPEDEKMIENLEKTGNIFGIEEDG